MSQDRDSCCCPWFCFISEEKNEDDIPTTKRMAAKDPISKESNVDVPDWLDTMLIEEALHQLGDKNLHVEHIHVSLATAPGDNYGSVLYRVKAALQGSATAQRCFLVKAPPQAPAIARSVKEVALFWRETAMLARLVPQMEALLQEAAPGRWGPLAARCPLHKDAPVEFLVLEDLAPEGFGMAERQRGMGLRHSLYAFRALARFHAASHALLKRDPAVAQGFDNPLRRTSDSGAFFLNSLQSTADACRAWPGYETYADDLEAFKKTAIDKIKELHDAKPGAFNVILHGDFWINNVMYRYTKGKPKDLRFVDFQISHVASPALDLLYFLSTSVSEDVSENHCDLLLREYHSSLQDTLELLGLQAPSLKALLQDVQEHGAYAVYGTALMLPILKSTKVPDVEAAVGGDADAGNYMYKDPVVKQWLQRVLPDFKRRGWLNQ